MTIYKCHCPCCKGKGKKPHITDSHEDMTTHLWEDWVTTEEEKE